MSSFNNPKELEMRTVESYDNTLQKVDALKENSYFDNAKVFHKNNISQLSKLGNNFVTEDLRKNIDIDIYGESATFDDFWKSISGKFNTSMMKGAKNKRILIPKNSIKTPSKSSERKGKKYKRGKGAESCRIEKYLKNADKFNYPGSSLSMQNTDSMQFATIDSTKIKIFKKNKLTNMTNLSKKIRKRKDYSSVKSGEYNVDGILNLGNWAIKGQPSLKDFLKSKRKSLSTDISQSKELGKVYKVKHNNSKKRSSSKNKSKTKSKPKYKLSSYVEKIKKPRDCSFKNKNLSTREKHSRKLSNFIDMKINTNHKSNESRDK